MYSNNINDLSKDDKIPKQGFLSSMGVFVAKFAYIKNYLSFVLTFICIVGSLALAWFKGISLDMLLPSLLGIFVLGRVGQKSVAMIAASKDPNADTRAVIQEMNNIEVTPKIQD